MSKLAIIYGSDEGNTESVAHRIAARFEADSVDIYDVADIDQTTFADYDTILLGIPTWDFGQIQSDWEEFWDDIQAVDFNGKEVALFGLGDQFGYGDYFLDAMGMLHDVIVANGAKIVGHWSTEGYDFEASKALTEDGNSFVGLALDEDQQEELSTDRINRWTEQISLEFTEVFFVESVDD